MAILIGLFFMQVNYNKSKRTKQKLTFLVAQIVTIMVTVAPIFRFTVDRYSFAIFDGYKWITVGFFIGLLSFIVMQKVSIRIFCLYLGIMMAFCLIELAEICFMY